MTLKEQRFKPLISLPDDGKRYTSNGFSERVLSDRVKEILHDYLKAHGGSDQNVFDGANLAQECEDKNIIAKNQNNSDGQPESDNEVFKMNWQGQFVEVSAPFSSELILETAKGIVDEAMPQFHGPYGGTGYSKIRRQRILDVVLWFFHSHKRFPVGDLGLDSNWVWVDGLGPHSRGRWYVWNGAGKRDKPCFWVHFKSISDDVLARCQSDWQYSS